MGIQLGEISSNNSNLNTIFKKRRLHMQMHHVKNVQRGKTIVLLPCDSLEDSNSSWHISYFLRHGKH